MTRFWAAGKTIDVGVFPTARVLGLTLDLNTIASTIFVALVIIGMGMWLRARATSGVPGKFQLLWELITVDLVGALAESAIGAKYRRFVPLGVTLFIFILLSNWLGFIPTALQPGASFDILPPPASDVNFPAALAIFVIVWVHVESIRARRVRGYIKHFFQPVWWLTPINLIEECVKPITLALRLFGNLFSGVLLLSLIQVLIPVYVGWLGELLWRPIDAFFIGTLQAYIFMLLAIMYFGLAMSHDEPEIAHGTMTPVPLTA